MNKFDFKNVNNDTWVRLLLCVFVVVLMIFSYFIDGNKLYSMAENALYITTLFISFWNNNSFTGAAIQADKYMNELKKGDSYHG